MTSGPGGYQVTLRNPWGSADTKHPADPKHGLAAGEFTMPWSQVAPWLQGYDMEVKGTVLPPGSSPGGSPPPSSGGSSSDATVRLHAEAPISTYAGVGFTDNVVADLGGSLNGYTDGTMSDFHAYINWGDGSGWTKADLAPKQGNTTFPFLVKGSHVYATQGTYHVVVYATGPDGTSTSGQTTTVYVDSEPSQPA
jgi:hypothetical protein